MKTLWSCEPFHQDKKGSVGLFRLLAKLAGKKEDVEACFVVTHTENDLNQAYDIAREERFTSYPKKILKGIFRKYRIDVSEKNIHVVDYPTYSTTAAVDRMLSLADERGSDLIGLFTHSRKGFRHLLMGSFAESTIHRSRKNLLLVNPKTRFSPQVRTLLYASDFSDESKSRLEELLKVCQSLKAKLVVFHMANFSYGSSFGDADPEAVKARNSVDRHVSWIEETCRKAGVRVQVVIQSKLEKVSDAALKLAKKHKAEMIAVVAKVGPLEAFMGGSITRQIVQKATIPVLVLKQVKN